VLEVGDKVTAYKVGDLVFRPTPVYPGQTLGPYHSSWGGFSEKGLITDLEAMRRDGREEEASAWAKLQVTIPIDIDPCEATLLITLKETLDWLHSCEVRKGDAVLLLGDGPVGQAFAFWLRYLGADPVVVWGHRRERCERIVELGATRALDTRDPDCAEQTRAMAGGDGFALAVDAIGIPSLRESALALLGPAGRVGWYGIDREPGHEELDPRVMRHSVDETRTHEEVLKAASDGKIDFTLFYDRVIPLDDIVQGFADIAQRRTIGKLLVACC
jgi:threonine dehydrogenase-like Zn-dependent dehydrogenase